MGDNEFGLKLPKPGTLVWDRGSHEYVEITEERQKEALRLHAMAMKSMRVGSEAEGRLASLGHQGTDGLRN